MRSEVWFANFLVNHQGYAFCILNATTVERKIDIRIRKKEEGLSGGLRNVSLRNVKKKG